MEDIFASPKHPSLFPMIIPCPQISKDDYHLFYKNERRLFTILLQILHIEVFQSIMIMGFFIWLEREGYSSKNLVEIIINSLSPEVINQLANEVILCLKFLQKIANNVSTSTEISISMLQSLLDRKDINLRDFYRNKDQIFSEVFVIAKDISVKAFEDIIEQQAIMSRNHGSVVMRSSGHANVHRPVPSYNIISPNYVRVYQNPSVGVGAAGGGSSTSRLDAQVMQNYAMMHHQQMVRLGGSANHRGVVPFYATGHGPYVVRKTEEEVPPEERTIFLTFSKGYPISENEVRDYFTRQFGDFIESIYMHDAGENQSLYARIVARSLSMARAVIERDGVDGKSKYYIDGKHVWARRFVKKTPSRNTNDIVAVWQR